MKDKVTEVREERRLAKTTTIKSNEQTTRVVKRFSEVPSTDIVAPTGEGQRFVAEIRSSPEREIPATVVVKESEVDKTIDISGGSGMNAEIRSLKRSHERDEADHVTASRQNLVP